MLRTILIRSCMLTAALAAAPLCADPSYGYHIRVTWLTNSGAQVDFSLRHPTYADLPLVPSQFGHVPLDCYYGNIDPPDWGIPDQTYDNPRWSMSTMGESNVEEIISDELLDMGHYRIIIYLVSGNATCRLDVLRWNHQDTDYSDTKFLSTDASGTRLASWERASEYSAMGIRTTKFTEQRSGVSKGRYRLAMNYTDLPKEMTTSDYVRIYLAGENVYDMDGTQWRSNNKKTLYFIGKPWTLRLDKRSNFTITVKGRANTLFESQNVVCNVFIGDYLGTNTFRTDKHCKYTYKERKELNPK